MKTKTPFTLTLSIWIVGPLFLLLYVYGIYDLFMMLGHNMDYYNANNFDSEVVVYFTDYPFIPLMLWILNLAGGTIAPVLLLLRSRWAVAFAGIAVSAKVLLEIITFGLMNRWEVLGPGISLFDICITFLTLLFYLYCRILARNDIIR